MRKSIALVSKHTCVLISFIFLAFSAKSQKTVTGRLVDSKDGSGFKKTLLKF